MVNLSKLKKKHTIKVPQNIQIIYCKDKNIITFRGPLQKKSLKLHVKVFLVQSSNLIVVTKLIASGASTTDFKSSKKIQGTTVAKIKQALTEITYTLHTKLRLVGVGYRVFAQDQLANQIYLKLGYSHLVHFKVPDSLTVFNQKHVKLTIFGNYSYDMLTQTAAQIRACRFPEPYKGKGVLYDQEKISLKKGKKI
jgi:large subunit ribosomal protein L6